MLRRLHPEQPATFAFTRANAAWAKRQMGKFPKGRQASAVIPLLWRAQEQEGWLTKAAIEHVADLLGMAYIRVLEVATFYFMFQLQPVGKIAHIQVCGTTPCMLRGAEDLADLCRHRIGGEHELSADGNFSWEEVECLGACTNAPMVQIGKDFYEDLTVESFSRVLDGLAGGAVPVPGPQNGRYAAEPASGLTTLKSHAKGRAAANGSVARALIWGDTVKRIRGDEKPGDEALALAPARVKRAPAKTKPAAKAAPSARSGPMRPTALKAARGGRADDLKTIVGVGPALEKLLHRLGFFHFDQIAAWTGAEVAWVDENLEGFKGRVTRDKWVAQAKLLAKKNARK
jgi:NADH-quinone oxidoreductase subunit E